MKKWISIILLTLYLCSTTELYQFLKIPVLIEHYVEHKEKNSQITVFAFLKMHYDHPVKDADWQTDQKLLFITHIDCLTVLCTVPQKFFLAIRKQQILPHKKTKTIHRDAVLDWEITNAIWQPPKFC